MKTWLSKTLRSTRSAAALRRFKCSTLSVGQCWQEEEQWVSEAAKGCSQQLSRVPGSELSCLGAVGVTGTGTYQFPAVCPHPCSPAPRRAVGSVLGGARHLRAAALPAPGAEGGRLATHCCRLRRAELPPTKAVRAMSWRNGSWFSRGLDCAVLRL